jgi:hypothetical protein
MPRSWLFSTTWRDQIHPEGRLRLPEPRVQVGTTRAGGCSALPVGVKSVPRDDLDCLNRTQAVATRGGCSALPGGVKSVPKDDLDCLPRTQVATAREAL